MSKIWNDNCVNLQLFIVAMKYSEQENEKQIKFEPFDI